MINPFLIGPEIYLRPPERSDAPLGQRWINDPDIRQTLLFQQPVSLQFEEEYLARMAGSTTDLALLIALRADDRPLGLIGLHQIDLRNRHAQLGIVVGEKTEWSKGYGTQATRLMLGHAFATLNLHRVCLRVYPDNTGAIRCYEKVGFQREGLLRQENFRAGRYWDTIVMGILREEWEMHESGSVPG